MESRKPPYSRQGHESFRYRSAIVDQYDGSDSESRGVSDLSSLCSSVASPKPAVVTRAKTHPPMAPPSSRATALQRLHHAASTQVVTNDFKPLPLRHSTEANRDSASIGVTFSIREEDEEESLLIQEESPPKPIVNHITEHERNAGAYTVIAFVNSGSGGGMGKTLQKSLQSHLGISNVVDLHSCCPGNMPEDTLLKYAYDPYVRILACGGDGTCGWIFSSLDTVWSTVLGQTSSKCHVHLSKYKDHLPLAIMPLGTGNDLSRQFGWGKAFKSHMKEKCMISSVQSSKLTSLDRWRCIMMPVEAMEEEEMEYIPKILGETYNSTNDDQEEEDYSRRTTVDLLHSLLYHDDLPEISTKKPKNQLDMSEPATQVFDGVFCNYFSLGFDATIAYHFHKERETHPEKFTSPTKNKIVYVQKSPYALKAPKLRKRLKVLVNNENGQLVRLKIPKSCRAIVLMNIQSYGGGNRLSREGSATDGLIEVIFVSNLIRAVSSAMSKVMPFLLFKVAAQTNNVCIRTRCPMHCQVDGEPWLQGEGVIQVKFHSRNSILEKVKVNKNCGCVGGSIEETVVQ